MKNLLGAHAVEEFTYQIPSFLQASVKANGPPDIPWDVSPTAPDCVVPIYVDSWWTSESLHNYAGRPRDWNELETLGLHFHSDMVSEYYFLFIKYEVVVWLAKHYNTGTDPQILSVKMELHRLKFLRDSIERGGKILEAEAKCLTERLVDLEEHLCDSAKAIFVMEQQFRDLWTVNYSRRLLEEFDARLDGQADDSEETSARSLSVQPPATTALRMSMGRIPHRNSSTFIASPSPIGSHSAELPPAPLGSTTSVTNTRPIKPLPRRDVGSDSHLLPHFRFTSGRNSVRPAATSQGTSGGWKGASSENLNLLDSIIADL